MVTKNSACGNKCRSRNHQISGYLGATTKTSKYDNSTDNFNSEFEFLATRNNNFALISHIPLASDKLYSEIRGVHFAIHRIHISRRKRYKNLANQRVHTILRYQREGKNETDREMITLTQSLKMILRHYAIGDERHRISQSCIAKWNHWESNIIGHSKKTTKTLFTNLFLSPISV